MSEKPQLPSWQVELSSLLASVVLLCVTVVVLVAVGSSWPTLVLSLALVILPVPSVLAGTWLSDKVLGGSR